MPTTTNVASVLTGEGGWRRSRRAWHDQQIGDRTVIPQGKIGYGLGDMASNFYLGFFGLFLLYYYTDVFGISPAAAATMLLVTKIIDAVSDPAMGLISDRTNTRWGKYRPYIFLALFLMRSLAFSYFSGRNCRNSVS